MFSEMNSRLEVCTWEGWLRRWPSLSLSQHHHISILQAVIPQGSGEVSKRLVCMGDLQKNTTSALEFVRYLLKQDNSHRPRARFSTTCQSKPKVNSERQILKTASDPEFLSVLTPRF